MGARVRITPAMAALSGAALLAAFGVIRAADVAWAARTMWRPLAGIVAIMVMTGVARRAGVLAGLANVVFEAARGSPARLFGLVFAFGAITAGVLNNDSAVLLLTPLVVDAAKRRHPHLVVPLAFAVFLSAGVAPVIVSNPMNMVVAEYSGIGFNEYAARMALPAVAGAIVTFAAARLLFHRVLAAKPPEMPPPVAIRARLDTPQRVVLVALGAVVCSYPMVSALGGPVWAVAVVGAVALLALASRAGHGPFGVVKGEVHFDVLAFLVAALLLSIGLKNVGVTAHLARLYEGAEPARVGIVSALGSSVLNNHPMANLNMLALDAAHASHRHVLAALVGGDLGPRLFPMGSLAGLLWLEMLRRDGIDVPVRKFLVVGAVATVPTIAVCLALL